MSEKKLASDNITANTYRQGHIDVLDGIRAVTVLIIVWFHFWQQSWIMPIYKNINLDWIPRNGAILVDMMILLSGFCLFLPYAKEMVYGTKTVPAKDFYIKRIARIFPSYYLCVAICLFCFALPLKEYSGSEFMIKDLLARIFFFSNFSLDTLFGTKLNGALWTVCVEVQFYILFPFIARFFQKKPIVTYTIMVLISIASCGIININSVNINTWLYAHNSFTYSCVFANGMLGAWIYIAITKYLKQNKLLDITSAVMAVTGLYLYKLMCHSRMQSDDIYKWQIDNRFALSLVYLLIVFSILMGQRIFNPLLGNKVMRFFAGISYNLYIWHQYISVKLKEFRIPYWEGTVAPNQLNDQPWMWKYLIICIAVSLLVAVFMTYCVEKPAAKFILDKVKK
ncbi:MAG: acyltransferase [Ruminococcaceae bacterium]|nr:acyltransferase [Oscillospiraceae bacterium]